MRRLAPFTYPTCSIPADDGVSGSYVRRSGAGRKCKDALREPVEQDEVFKVIQRRLLEKMPEEAVAGAAAFAYQQIFTQMRKAYAASAAEEQQAAEEGIQLRDRMRLAYPFHPALLDLMRQRWASLPEYQRTRGALRFLAACLTNFSLKIP